MALRFSESKLAQARRYMRQAVSDLSDYIHTHKLNCDYEPTGFLRVATTPAQVRRMQRQVRLAQGMGFDGVDWLDERETRALVDSPAHLGAWHDAHGALVNPASLARELKRIAIGAGIEIYEHSPVTRLELGDKIRAQTPRGRAPRASA